MTYRCMRVEVDVYCSPAVDVVSGVSQGSVLGPLLFVLYTHDLFDVVENFKVNNADDYTLLAVFNILETGYLRPKV